MNIVGIKPIYGGSLPVMEYALEALHQLGHRVTAIDFSSYLPMLHYIRTTNDEKATILLKEKTTKIIIETLEIMRPDVLFGIAQAPIFRPVLRFCKRHNIVSVFWFVEDFRRFTYWKDIAGLYDFFFVIQKSPFTDIVRKLCPRSFYLPLAAEPSVHRPLNLSEKERREYGSSVSFVGAGYPNRVALFEKLELEDFKIWGSDWNLSRNSGLHKFLQRNGARIDVKEYVKIFNASPVNLNLHSSLNPDEMGSGDFVNPRTFEIAACRAFQIVDYRTLLGELFEEGEEIIACRTIYEMKRAIRKALEDPEWRMDVARKGYRRVLREHTYLHRIKTLLEILERNA